MRKRVVILCALLSMSLIGCGQQDSAQSQDEYVTIKDVPATGEAQAGQDGKDGIDGQDGQDGKDGADGQNGRDGKDGKDGVGIQTAVVDENGDLLIGLTDGTVINAGHVKGEDGKDGKNGSNGTDGANGRDGSNGKDGADGADNSDDIPYNNDVKVGDSIPFIIECDEFTPQIYYRFHSESVDYPTDSKIYIDSAEATVTDISDGVYTVELVTKAHTIPSTAKRKVYLPLASGSSASGVTSGNNSTIDEDGNITNTITSTYHYVPKEYYIPKDGTAEIDILGE